MPKLTRMLSYALAFAVFTIGAPQAQDDDRASLDEAQILSEQAAAFLSAEGPDVAFPAFNDGDDWHDRDLYVFVVELDGTMVAHGANAALIGENLIDLTDPSGTRLIAEIVNVEDQGWVDYQFQNPQTGEIEPKRSYVIRVDEQYAVGVGAYVQ